MTEVSDDEYQRRGGGIDRARALQRAGSRTRSGAHPGRCAQAELVANCYRLEIVWRPATAAVSAGQAIERATRRSSTRSRLSHHGPSASTRDPRGSSSIGRPCPRTRPRTAHETIFHERCHDDHACLAPYAPHRTRVPDGTYYAFDQRMRDVREYAAELAVRYFLEHEALLAGSPSRHRSSVSGRRTSLRGQSSSGSSSVAST